MKAKNAPITVAECETKRAARRVLHANAARGEPVAARVVVEHAQREELVYRINGVEQERGAIVVALALQELDLERV